MRAIILATIVALVSTSASAIDLGGSRSSATAGAVSVSGAAAGAVSGSSASGGSSSASVQSERQAPAVAAPSLATSGETCMGSSSVGASGAGFGLAIGTTWGSEQCERRMNAQQLRLSGETKAALALICMNPGVADAMRAVGKSCPVVPEKVDAAMRPPAVSDAGFCQRWPADPYCRDQR